MRLEQERVDLGRCTRRVVPWVPYYARSQVHLVGPHVTQCRSDQFGGDVGYARVAVS